ncbi:putative inorganic phosphate cotransporter [Macrobrachium rosenbergii]|uniref:putative inorganic phosphate cotransporter n=1 Tax=Macrobrachium rosenbergii TaxID=79674 RepID=UPI0034D5C8F1
MMDKSDNESVTGSAGCIYSVELPGEGHHHQPNERNKNHGWTDWHTFALMSLLGQCIAFMNRGCLSVAIVAMVSSGSNSTHGGEEHGDVCPVPPSANDTLGPEKEGEFDWDEQLQGVVLGSFFYGYVSMCFIGGLLADYFGGRLMYGVSVMGSSLLSVLSPISARTCVGLFIADRVISGFLLGPLFPSLNSLMASRISPRLRTKYSSICLIGSTCGTVISMALGGVLASSSFLGGWPSVFYVFGTAGILWGILWFLLIKEDPSNELLREAMHSQNRNQFKDIKFKSVFTSLPFWSLVFFYTGDSFGYFMLSSEIPTYLSNIQYFHLDENGLISSLPYILKVLFIMAWGMFINRLIISGKISILASRKISAAVGMHGAGLALCSNVLCQLQFVDCCDSPVYSCGYEWSLLQWGLFGRAGYVSSVSGRSHHRNVLYGLIDHGIHSSSRHWQHHSGKRNFVSVENGIPYSSCDIFHNWDNLPDLCDRQGSAVD